MYERPRDKSADNTISGHVGWTPTSVLTLSGSLACRFTRYDWPVRPKLLCKAVNDGFTASRGTFGRVQTLYHISYDRRTGVFNLEGYQLGV